jgi:hypothetical protein
LQRKFNRLQGSWENLIQSTVDYDETVVFAELAGLVEVTEAATKAALFGSEDLLQKLRDRDLCDGIAYYGADDTSGSEDAHDSGQRSGQHSHRDFSKVCQGGPGKDAHKGIRTRHVWHRYTCWGRTRTTIALMPSLLCRLQILFGLDLGQFSVRMPKLCGSLGKAKH